MGLRDGFVPVGMKEYGGILYIASYNPNTNEGQLGTIPSPLINYTYSNSPYDCTLNLKITDINPDEFDINKKYSSTPMKISDKRFQVGDQFIINLDFEDFTTTRSCRKESNKYVNIEYPLISGFNFKS